MANENLCIAIYAATEKSFLERKKSLSWSETNVLWCPSETMSRKGFLKNHLQKWILFLDQDCELTFESWAEIEHCKKQELDKTKIWTGFYLNPPHARYLQRVHNFIANHWIQQAFQLGTQQKPLLGGIFLIYTGSVVTEETPEKLFWGAEDLLLAYELQDLGYEILFNSKLQVIHHTSSSLKHFLRRAWLHGVNHRIYIEEKEKKQKAKYFYWFDQIRRADLLLATAVVFHFGIQKLAKGFQKVRQTHKLK